MMPTETVFGVFPTPYPVIKSFAAYFMKIGTSKLSLLALIMVVLSGCSRDDSVKSGISKLEEAFPAASVAVPSDGDGMDGNTPRQVDVNAYVGQAISSLQRNDYVGAVSLLNAVRTQTTLTTQQRMAVHESIRTVYADLVARVARGDQKAQTAIKQLEKTYSQ